jgi:hypothetical protein
VRRGFEAHAAATFTSSDRVRTGMSDLATSVDVDAPPERVWAVLTAFDRYPEWNPTMRIRGRPNLGAHLDVELHLPDARPRAFRPTVTRVDRPHELRWLGHLFVPGLYDGEHRFRVEDLGDGRSRLHHGESFSGLLVAPINRLLGSRVRRGFEAMNEALRERAETLDRDSATEEAESAVANE